MQGGKKVAEREREGERERQREEEGERKIDRGNCMSTMIVLALMTILLR